MPFQYASTPDAD